MELNFDDPELIVASIRQNYPEVRDGKIGDGLLLSRGGGLSLSSDCKNCFLKLQQIEALTLEVAS